MDRRRFVPAPEGLESRALQSFFGHSSSSLTNTTPTQDLPLTSREKELRIEHLPFYLRQIQPGRFLNDANLAQLQTDLRAIVGQLHPAPSKALDQFNHNLRDVLPDRNLSINDAKILNSSFGFVLNHAGATPEATARLQADMNELALVDSKSRQPVFLATNDYSLVLQTALGVGRPIARPEVPMLAVKDGGNRNMSGYGITRNHEPTLVGTYLPGTTAAASPAGVTMQIIDDRGNILGSGTVAGNGKYEAKITTPLADGIYTLHVRALDPQGLLSDPSPAFRLKVISRPGEVVTGQSVPQGPLGLGARPGS